MLKYLGQHFSVIAMVAMLGISLPSDAQAEQVRVAVASNFLTTVRLLKNEFEKSSGHKVLLSVASTGKLYAQISHGAPFEIFLSADARRPGLAVDSGLAVEGTQQSYARGRLTLWSSRKTLEGKDCKEELIAGHFRRLSIANPKTAPYGEAARQALKKMKLWQAVRPKLVRGENIGQTFQYTRTGNAELGMIALSQALDPKNNETTCRWDIPEDYHQPLEQHMVMLKRGEKNPAAKAFYDFIKSEAGKKIISETGYGV